MFLDKNPHLRSVKKFLAGSSFGGCLAVLIAERMQFDGLIIKVPFFDFKSNMLKKIRPLVNCLSFCCCCIKRKPFNKGEKVNDWSAHWA